MIFSPPLRSNEFSYLFDALERACQIRRSTLDSLNGTFGLLGPVLPTSADDETRKRFIERSRLFSSASEGLNRLGWIKQSFLDVDRKTQLSYSIEIVNGCRAALTEAADCERWIHEANQEYTL